MEKMKVSERALLNRVNRALAKDRGDKVVRCKASSKWIGELGRYYAIDESRNTITAKQIDLAEWARELGVLAEWEMLEE